MLNILRYIIVVFFSFGIHQGYAQYVQQLIPSNEPELEFSIQGGYYTQPIELTLLSTGDIIYYTTDGSLPDETSEVFQGPIAIDSTMVIRAVAQRDTLRSQVQAHTYLIREPYSRNFPTVSLSLNPSLLFDPEQGLFMMGANAVDSLYAKPGANFWSRREILIHGEIFDEEGRSVFNSECGMRLFGGMSRLWPQKSLAIVARDQYGKKRIKHKFFGKEGLKSFKFLVLRNSGGDFGKTHFRDALMTSLVDHWDIEKQDSRPAHVYINGRYWGIYNIREKVNKYFIEDHAGIDEDNIDLIEHYMTLKKGSTQHYRDLLTFLEQNSLKDSINYQRLDTMMEIDNYRRHQIAQIYFDNRDAGGNIKFWRPRSRAGRWRWILFDTDWGFGLHDKEAYKLNTLDFHTAEDGPSWPNPPWSTFILRKLLENPQFESAFVNNFADHLNTSFKAQKVEAQIDKFYTLYLPEIDRHLERWNLSKQTWEREVQVLRTFARNRPQYIWQFLEERFNTGAARYLKAEATSGGYIIINNMIKIREKEFQGRYFENYPINLKAVPNYGYKFSHWEGVKVMNSAQEFTLKLDKERYQIRAVFVPYTHPLAGEVIINEISPKSGRAGDWLEIYNNSDATVNLQDWVLTDSKHQFQLPRAVIPPRDYLIICEDVNDFFEVYPNAYNIIGGMPFGLNKVRERIGLYANLNAMVDSVAYSMEPLDSSFTLNLLLPDLDNGDPDNWILRFGNGTPCAANPYYIESRIRKRQQLWVQLGASIAVFLMCCFLIIIRKRGLI